MTRIEFQLPHLNPENFQLNKDSQTEFFSQPRVVVSAVSNSKEPKTSTNVVSSVPSEKS